MEDAHDHPTGRLVLDVPEAAALLGCGRSTMYHLVLTGQVRSLKVGRLRRIPLAALYEFVEKASEPAGGLRAGHAPLSGGRRVLPLMG